MKMNDDFPLPEVDQINKPFGMDYQRGSCFFKSATLVVILGCQHVKNVPIA